MSVLRVPLPALARIRLSLPPAAAGPEPAAPAGGALGRLRAAALAAITFLVTAATLVSFAESYRGLYDWAAGHGLGGVWAAAWPLMVDVFIAVGELALFVAMTDQWRGRARVLPWSVTLGGLAVSVAANVGHVAGASLTSRATAAVPPLAASAALSVGLAVLKRVRAGRPAPARPAASPPAAVPPAAPASAVSAVRPAPALPAAGATGARDGRQSSDPTAAEVASHFRDLLAEGQLPSQAAIRTQWHVGSPKAKALREAVAERAGLPLAA